MTRVLILLMIMGTISSTAIAQSKKKYKEIKMTKKSEVINVSADKLWQIVGPGFENAGDWSTAVDHSSGHGKAEFSGATCSERKCDLNASGFNKIAEKLVHYDQVNQNLTYSVYDGMPGFVTLAQNNWQVIEIGPNQSVLQMTMTMHMKKFMGALMGGMMKKNINTLMPGVFRDIKVYAETGEISEEKKERMAKLEAKK